MLFDISLFACTAATDEHGETGRAHDVPTATFSQSSIISTFIVFKNKNLFQNISAQTEHFFNGKSWKNLTEGIPSIQNITILNKMKVTIGVVEV